MKTEIKIKKVEKANKIYYFLEIWYYYKSGKRFREFSTLLNKEDYDKYNQLLSK